MLNVKGVDDLFEGRLVATADSDPTRMRLSRAHARGEIARLLPGVYCPSAASDDLVTRCAAVMALDPDAVIAGRAAAALTWWPDVRVADVTAYRRHSPADQRGFAWLRGQVPPELISQSNGLRVTNPALTVLDLLGDVGGQAIDEALRRRAVTLERLSFALDLTPERPGNRERRRLLHDSRDEPWSELERLLHRQFRALGIAYRTNYRVVLGDAPTRGTVHGPSLGPAHELTPTKVAFIDVALPELMLAFEADGYEFHSPRQAFERDRERDARLAALGWAVVRLTWSMVEAPTFGARIRQIVAAREAHLTNGLSREPRARSRGPRPMSARPAPSGPLRDTA